MRIQCAKENGSKKIALSAMEPEKIQILFKEMTVGYAQEKAVRMFGIAMGVRNVTGETMSKERDEKAEMFASISYNDGDKLSKARLSISYAGYKAGWDAALESEAVSKLVDALEGISNAAVCGAITPPNHHFGILQHCMKRADDALQEFEHAKEGK